MLNLGQHTVEQERKWLTSSAWAYPALMSFLMGLVLVWMLGSDYTAVLNNNSGNLTMEYYAYMTATGATSFEWDVYAFATIADRNSAISSWGATGTATTTQDGTSGLGEDAQLTHNSGGRGYLLLQPAALGGTPPADAVSHKVVGKATNSNGTTTTNQLLVTWQVV